MSQTAEKLPASWAKILPPDAAQEPMATVTAERQAGITIYPPEGMVFNALRMTPPEKVRVVILGQDPYHEPGQAMGLAFAVPPECRPLPPSLRNILKEYQDDLDVPLKQYPDLGRWAKQGVLLLNTTLTVRAHKALSHAKIGWENFTDAVISAVSQHCPHVVFMLWGRPAQLKQHLIDKGKHLVLTAAHPSPLSAYRGFFGSRPFSDANLWLESHKLQPIEWTAISDLMP